MHLDTENITETLQETFEDLQQTETMHGDPSGNVLFHGKRFNIMGSDYFMADMYHMLIDVHGAGAGGILHGTGVTYGEDLLTLLEDNTSQNMFGQLLGLLAFLGYSTPTVRNDRIIFPSSPTAEEYRKKEYEPRKTCYFLSGILSGAIDKLFPDEKVRFLETECRANGDDCCTFSIETQDN